MSTLKNTPLWDEYSSIEYMTFSPYACDYDQEEHNAVDMVSEIAHDLGLAYPCSIRDEEINSMLCKALDIECGKHMLTFCLWPFYEDVEITYGEKDISKDLELMEMLYNWLHKLLPEWYISEKRYMSFINVCLKTAINNLKNGGDRN